jgi:serine/threonine protein kinase
MTDDTRGPEVLLCDFGRGKLIVEQAAAHTKAEASSNFAPASTNYIAPEVKSGKPYTEAADVYAAAVFMIHAFLDYAKDQLTAPIPRHLWDICDQCIATEPSERLETYPIVCQLEDLEPNFLQGNVELETLQDLLKKCPNIRKLRPDLSANLSSPPQRRPTIKWPSACS